MWELRGRDNKIKQWSEYGDFPNIADAARRILELEGDPYGAFWNWKATRTAHCSFACMLTPTRLPARQRTLNFSPALNTRAKKASIC
jgi:hypothetical protein